MDLGMPITLVVKAPNQKIEDQTIECGLGWTIKDLKEHISNVYPSKPLKHQQKLIYSGRLLNDHLVLKDVLRQYDTETAVHTVHLVCAQPSGEQQQQQQQQQQQPAKPSSDKAGSPSASSSPSPSSTPPPLSPSTPPLSPSPSQEGVRRRAVPAPASTPSTTEAVPITTTTPAPQPMPDAFQNMYGGMYAGGYYPGMVPGMMPGMMPFSPEQMMWFQQMYAQQMAQYMQLYQAGAVPQAVPPTITTPAPPPPGDAPVNQNAGAGGNRAPARDPGMRMNAQGGMVLDDDEDEMNRDWLDWTYTFTRIAVLLSIVYFYSTFGRFLLVFSLFVAAYMYQAGWFGVQRRNQAARNPEPAPQEQPQPQPQQQQQQQQQPPPPPAAGADIGDRQEDNTVEETSEDEDTTSDEAGVAAEPVEQPRPRPLAVAWSFFYTFFSSLIPEQPVAVNAN